MCVIVSAILSYFKGFCFAVKASSTLLFYLGYDRMWNVLHSFVNLGANQKIQRQLFLPEKEQVIA